jgi:hypothetical protein
LALSIPGWLIVTMFDPRETQLANRLTDILIPFVSGLFWTSLALLVVKLFKFARH